MATVKPSTRVARRTGQFSGVQVMFAAILSIGLFLAIDFSGRITASQPLHEAYERVQQEIAVLEREQTALFEERDYVRSDAYVSIWARTEGRMILPGEVLVISVPAVEGVAAEAIDVEPITETVQTSAPPPPPWTIWWSLFFDSPPPITR
jgi:cell division protein FtsB